jgi:hypothetical protein
MIPDPLTSISQNVSGSGLGLASVVFDLVSSGPGSQTLRKTALPPVAGLTLTITPKHEVTTAGRRRSTFRVDVKAPIGTPFGGGTSIVPHSASAYIVCDRLNDDSAATKTLIDMATALLLNSFCASRANYGAEFVATSYLTDFMNGEP